MIEKLEGWKKLIAAIVATIVALIGFEKGMDAAQVGIIVAPLATYLLSQGMADFGKAAAAKQPTVVELEGILESGPTMPLEAPDSLRPSEQYRPTK